ncbi:TetR/AcrR family transcriptional regulator [Paenarthrobacter sp. NPDC092416]|uniref:TetR/AcrR family transcriptional regulator n=1 Tax=Paenarthrobacter sp. NPDC092416 TaxID=3364386 RepID=UPI00381AA27E
MPKLWNETIEEHRGAVRTAILDAVADLVVHRGLLSVTMSQIAQDAGIGRATLYKYFPDVEAVLDAWHERQIGYHLAHLSQIRDDTAGDPLRTLEEVLQGYALMAQSRPSGKDAARLHYRSYVGHAEEHLNAFLAELLAEGASAGVVRGDIASDELAGYCLHALGAAAGLTSGAALRLVGIIMTGLRPETQRSAH